MALTRQRRHQQALASPMGWAGNWLHQHSVMVAPADTAQKAGSPQPGQRWVLVEPSSCAITASWASLSMADQRPISVRVRPQPRQRPSFAWQWPMQGLGTYSPSGALSAATSVMQLSSSTILPCL